MTPFVDDGSLVEQHQSRVTSDDGFQCRSVSSIERVLCPGNVPPVLHGFVRACRKSVESVAVLFRILIDGINVSEVAVVSPLQYGCNEQEGVSVLGQYAVSEVFPCFLVSNGEVMNRWLIALFEYFLVSIFKHPRRVIVGIILLSKLPGHAVLFADESRLVGCQLRPFGYLHPFLDVLPDVIRTEVKDGQMVKAQYGCREDEDNREVKGNPLVGL